MSEHNWEKGQIDNIWNDEILKFPRIETYLKNEVIRQKNLYGSLVNDVKVRKQIDTDKKMKQFDREINLNRMLNRNPRYRGIGRNKPPLSNFLEPILVANIRHNPTKVISKITIDKLSRTTKRCPKFLKHMRDYDENEFKRVYALGTKPEEEEEDEENTAEEIEEQPSEEQPEEVSDEILLEENLAELVEANADTKLDTNLNNQEPPPVPIKEEPKKEEEEETTPRVLTPASDILDDNLPSYASDEQFGIIRSSPTASMNLIIPKNQAAQVKFKFS